MSVDPIGLLVSIVILMLVLVAIWGFVWVIQTYIVGQAPFIPPPFKQVINWVVTVVAIIASMILVISVLLGKTVLWRTVSLDRVPSAYVS